MRVLDGAVCVLDGNQGVEPQTETVWRQGDKYGVPRIIFANKMDKTGADFYMCVTDIKEKLGARPVPLQIPIGAEASFKGVVDLLRMKAIVWDGDDKDSKFNEEEIPADLADKAAEFRAQMIEAAVEMDDDAMGAYLDGKEPDVDTLKRLIRKATVKGIFYPMLCGSAFKYKGVQPLLDAVVDYLPSPADREAFEAIDVKTGEPAVRRPLDTDPLSMLAFKIMDDPHVGSITFCRVYSGTVRSGMALTNTTRDRKERVGRMYLMHADDREQIDEAYAGDIIALAGLKDTRTGETLSDPQQARAAGEDGVPQPRHRDEGRAQDQGRRGEDGPGARQARGRGPLVPRHDRPGERRDHHQGHGRAASRHQGRHPQAHAQGRGQRRRAAGGLPRDLGAVDRASTTRTRSRPAAPASSPASS